ncbi:hypothetical protein TgHK011_005517 [Trichoderma gracile]|nr:hypothetical protein TgHK011_005517 [Trichoderma gracile]
MAHNTNHQGREPFRDPWAGPRPDQHLSHKVSALSDASDLDGRYDPDDGPHPLRGRESIHTRTALRAATRRLRGPAPSPTPAPAALDTLP